VFSALPVWLNVTLTLAALVALAGGVFGYFKSSAGDRTLKLAAEEIRLLNERDQRRSTELEALAGKFEICKTQLQTQANTIALLTDTVTGASAIKELAELIRLNHEEVVKEHRELVRKLNARSGARKRTR
jgi:hypothetical protein